MHACVLSEVALTTAVLKTTVNNYLVKGRKYGARL